MKYFLRTNRQPTDHTENGSNLSVHNRWMDKEDVTYISICVYIYIVYTCMYIQYMYTYICYNVILLCHKKEWNLAISHNMHVSGECVISSVLSHHNKHMKQWTLKPSASHNSQTVLQLCVTAQFYLDNKGKYILEEWGHANPKDMKRRERESVGERSLPLWVSFLYVLFPSPGPALCKLG